MTSRRPRSRGKSLGERYGLEVDLDRVAELCEEQLVCDFPRPADDPAQR